MNPLDLDDLDELFPTPSSGQIFTDFQHSG